MSTGFVYILCNDRQNVLYTGSAADLKTRINHHKKRYVPGFTKKYNVHRLIYFEEFQLHLDAVAREKQIKGYGRDKKVALITAINPSWRDLRLATKSSSPHSTHSVQTERSRAGHCLPMLSKSSTLI